VSLSVDSLITGLDRCSPEERSRIERVLDEVAALYQAKTDGPAPGERNRLAGVN